MLDPEVTYVSKIKKDDPKYEAKMEYSTILADCTNFLNKKTSLMYLEEHLRVDVDCSTKVIRSLLVKQ